MEAFHMTTMTANFFGNQNGWSPAALAGGVSDVAQQIGNHFKRVRTESSRTATGQQLLHDQRAALMDNYAEAQALAEHGDSLAPSAATLREAHDLLAALPSWARAPSPIVEPSGAIALEWDLGPTRFLVFAVKGTGVLEHSAILGLGNERYGTNNFAGTLGKNELNLLADLMQTKV
jgi:hypothetical protein